MGADTVQFLSGIRDVCHVVGLQGAGFSSALNFIQYVGSFVKITTETMWEIGVATACGTLRVHISKTNMLDLKVWKYSAAVN